MPMTPEQWERLKEVFSEAVERHGEERERYLTEACGGDDELLRSVLSLIRGHEVAADFPSFPRIGSPLPEQHPPTFGIGEVVAGRFRIEEFLARGGMGEVYRAWDNVIGQEVAMKTVQRGIRSAHAFDALKHEIQSARRVTHPNVCRTYDIAESGESGVVLLTMELLKGPTLSRYLRDHGPMTRSEALPLIEQLAAGLQAAHDAGVVHRDFKSGNIILVGQPGSWRPVITDFGLALSPQSRRKDSALKAGTPGYMAPEQVAGKPATAATDVYAFGVVVAAMLGARRLAASDASPSPGTAAPNAVEDWNKLGEWRHVVERCLAEDPAKRYQRPTEAVRALRGSGRAKWRLLAAAIALASLASAVILLQTRIGIGSGAMGTRRIAEERTQEVFWSLAQDGSRMAVTNWKDGQLSLRDLTTGTSHPLTKQKTPKDAVWSAIFDPQGERIAYVLYFDGGEETRTVSSNGYDDRLLLTDPEVASATPKAWSPDGRQIAVLARWKDGRSGLGLLTVSSGFVVPVSLSEKAKMAGSVYFSPSGQELLFDAPKAGSQRLREIRVVGIRGGGERLLISNSADCYLAGVSPDGRRLAFVSDLSGTYGIWSAPLGGDLSVGEPQVALAASGRVVPLGISREGSLHYKIDLNFHRVYTARLDLKTRNTVRQPREEALGMYPSWSPVGELAFLGLRDLAHPALIVIPPGGEPRREYPSQLAVLERPQWRTQNSLVGIGLSAGREGFFEVETNAGRVTYLGDFKTFDTGFEGAWSKNGTVWFNRFVQNRRGLFRFDFKTQKREILFVPDPGQDMGLENLALSPDERTLAFQLREGPNRATSSLMLLSVSGGPPRRLLSVKRPEAFQFGAFTWLPDSRSVLVAKSRLDTGRSELWVVPLDGAPPQQIKFPAVVVRQLRLSPDGSTIAWHSGEGELSELWALDHFLPTAPSSPGR